VATKFFLIVENSCFKQKKITTFLDGIKKKVEKLSMDTFVIFNQ